MFKTFKAELKHIFKSKWRTAGLILLIFIPFVYGFLYMNAYWAPFQHVDKLKIAVVSRDLDASGKELATSKLLSDNLEKTGLSSGPNQIYDIVRPDSDISKNPEEAVDSGEYAGVVIIPKWYSASMDDFYEYIKDESAHITANSKLAALHLTGYVDYFNRVTCGVNNQYITGVGMKTPSTGTGSTVDLEGNFDRVNFYFSYKHSYLAGEMANFLSTNTMLVLNSFVPKPTQAVGALTSAAGGGTVASMAATAGASLVSNSPSIQDAIKGLVTKSNLVHITRTGRDTFKSYGTGLAPYFISIAMFAGALATLFVVKNERHIDSERTIKHFFGKAAVWWMISILQATILITALTIQGVRVGDGSLSSQWRLYLFVYFMALVFPMIAMPLSYMIRYGDIGEFLVVIVLVAQLISSSGTFPVEMQNVVFKIIHPVAPFTYTISALREIMWATDTGVLFMNMGILLIFPAVLIPLSLAVNWRFDIKTFRRLGHYESYEIHMGDF